MKHHEMSKAQPELNSDNSSSNTDSTWDGSVVYREWAEVPVQVVNPLSELQRNVSQLEDLQARMRFMVREIRQMMKV